MLRFVLLEVGTVYPPAPHEIVEVTKHIVATERLNIDQELSAGGDLD